MGDQLRSKGFVGAAIVMLGGPGAGSKLVSVGNFGWSRFVMKEGLGVWVGELLHQGNLCNLRDLFVNAGFYPSGDNMGPFEQEAGYQATHLSAWTKRAVGWLEPSAIAQHSGGAAEYTLHAASLIQPPPTGRVAAVQIGTEVPYLMVEARLKADQFDINIPNEGVIVYRSPDNRLFGRGAGCDHSPCADHEDRADGRTIDHDGRRNDHYRCCSAGRRLLHSGPKCMEQSRTAEHRERDRLCDRSFRDGRSTTHRLSRDDQRQRS